MRAEWRLSGINVGAWKADTAIKNGNGKMTPTHTASAMQDRGVGSADVGQTVKPVVVTYPKLVGDPSPQQFKARDI